MSKPKARSTLYRLIEAGQLAHKALLVPLLERGLEPGDDAVLFVLHDKLGATEDGTRRANWASSPKCCDRALERLIERDLVARQADRPGTGARPGPHRARRAHPRGARRDTGRSWRMRCWANCTDKKRKGLRKTLRRFVELLRL